MTESTFTRKVNNCLPGDVYKWKISDRFTAGIPDSYYSGDKADLWVEYKWVKKLPKLVKPKLSQLQRLWLNARLSEGRNVAVIVGSPQGCVLLLEGAWNDSKDPETVLTAKQIAQWITNEVTNH